MRWRVDGCGGGWTDVVEEGDMGVVGGGRMWMMVDECSVGGWMEEGDMGVVGVDRCGGGRWTDVVEEGGQMWMDVAEEGGWV